MTKTSVWDLAVTRCDISSSSNTQKIIIARLRRVPRKGGVIDVLEFALSDKTLRGYYTTIPFSRLSEDVMAHLRIPSGNHEQAIALMLSDLPMTVRGARNRTHPFYDNRHSRSSICVTPVRATSIYYAQYKFY